MPRLSRTALSFCAVVLATLPVLGQDAAGEGVRQVDQITFSPARGGSVLQVTGNRLRCDLISMTAEKVVVQNNNRTNEIEMARVRSIRSTDGKFEYTPDREDFDSLLRRCRRIPGVTLGKLQVFDDLEPEGPNAGHSAEVAAGHAAQATGHAAQPPAASAAPVTPVTNVTGVGAAPAVTPPAETTSPSTASTGGGAAICANCMKEIPATLQNGDRCPHCGVIFWDASRPIAPASSAAGGHAANSGSQPGQPVEPDSIMTARGPKSQTLTSAASRTNAATGDSSTDLPVTTTTGGGGFDSIPLPMKIGAFIGMLAIAWLLLQRR